MQVSLKTASLTTSAPATAGRGTIDAPQSVTRASAPQTTSRNSFPESALLSRRPMRYNVQLNQQLTAVQQADSYLAKTETQLLQLRQSAARGDDLSAHSSALQKHLARRSQLSGGTVDRHLSASLEQKTAVSFTLPGCEKLLHQPDGETLVFSLGGRQREMVAIALPEEATPRQTLTRLNVGLGRLGIHATQASNGQLKFSVGEDRWERVSQQLTVRGEGGHFPADAFTLLAPQAESASSDEMQALTSRWEREGQTKLHAALEHITTQRSRLRQQQDRVSARISDMETVFTPRQAQETSRALGEVLAGSRGFGALSQALGAQANVRLATVKNLLG